MRPRWASLGSRYSVAPRGIAMVEQLHRFARVNEIVPVESWRKDGVEGWLFRNKENELLFFTSSELLGHQPVEA